MTNKTEDKDFFERANEIINLANTQCDIFAIGKVFIENIDGYIKNYEKNIEEQRNSYQSVKLRKFFQTCRTLKRGVSAH